MTAANTPVVAVITRSPETGFKLLESAPRDLGRNVGWILVTPLPDEVVRSETWTVIRYPWKDEDKGRGSRLGLDRLARPFRLGRLLADADVVAWADALTEKDVRAVGTIYRKLALPYAASNQALQEALGN